MNKDAGDEDAGAVRRWLDALTGHSSHQWKCAGCSRVWLSPTKAAECSSCGSQIIIDAEGPA